MLILLKLLLILLLLPSITYAATYPAATCEEGDINTAIGLAVDGDTVTVPSGNCEWTSDVTISGKGITLQGAGVGNTVITNGQTSAYDGVLEITTDASHSVVVKGFTFKGKPDTNNNDHIIDITGNSTDENFRIYDCRFDSGWSTGSGHFDIAVAIYVNGSYGLIDNNTFDDSGKEVVQITGESGHWISATDAGSVNAVYIEDNTFYQDVANPTGSAHAIMGTGAARYVFRYNTVSNYNIDAHGYCGNANGGTRLYEIYSNDIITESGFSQSNWFFIRGGTGVIYNNTGTSTGTVNNPITLTEYRVDEDYCSKPVVKCCCDTGGNGGEGYPCENQIGRGNAEASDPLYIWNNTNDGSAITPYVKDLSGDCDVACGVTQVMSDYVQDETGNADYYDDGTVKPGYTAYTYPHPQRGTTHTTTIGGGSQLITVGGGSQTITIN